MKAILKVFNRKLIHVLAETKKDEKGKSYTVAERYDYLVDDENNEPQTLRVEPNNEVALAKINKLKNQIYTSIYILVEIYFYQKKPFKIVVLDVLNENEDMKEIECVLNKYLAQEETKQ